MPRKRPPVRRLNPRKDGIREKFRATDTFLPDNLMLVRMIALDGYSNEDMERLYGLVPGTIKKWASIYPDFAKALREGRTNADAEVLVSLYKRATGYDYEEEVAVGGRSPTVMKVKRHAVPDVDAAKWWLKNRRRNEWRDKHEHEVTGKGGGPIGVKNESKEEIISAILSLVQPKPDAPKK